jgi:hypothetical protein
MEELTAVGRASFGAKSATNFDQHVESVTIWRLPVIMDRSQPGWTVKSNNDRG